MLNIITYLHLTPYDVINIKPTKNNFKVSFDEEFWNMVED